MEGKKANVTVSSTLLVSESCLGISVGVGDQDERESIGNLPGHTR